jgi:hypothetical protein
VKLLLLLSALLCSQVHAISKNQLRNLSINELYDYGYGIEIKTKNDYIIKKGQQDIIYQASMHRNSVANFRTCVLKLKEPAAKKLKLKKGHKIRLAENLMNPVKWRSAYTKHYSGYDLNYFAYDIYGEDFLEAIPQSKFQKFSIVRLLRFDQHIRYGKSEEFKTKEEAYKHVKNNQYIYRPIDSSDGLFAQRDFNLRDLSKACTHLKFKIVKLYYDNL